MFHNSHLKWFVTAIVHIRCRLWMFTCRHNSFNPLFNANNVGSSYVSLCFYGSPQERLVQIWTPAQRGLLNQQLCWLSKSNSSQSESSWPLRQSTGIPETRRPQSALTLNSVIPGSEASLMNKWSYLYPRSQLGELWWSRWGCREERHRLSAAPPWERDECSQVAYLNMHDLRTCPGYAAGVETSEWNASTLSLVRVVLTD